MPPKLSMPSIKYRPPKYTTCIGWSACLTAICLQIHIILLFIVYNLSVISKLFYYSPSVISCLRLHVLCRLLACQCGLQYPSTHSPFLPHIPLPLYIVHSKFPLAPMGVLASGSAHARHSAQPPINTSGNFTAHVSAESPSNISPNPSEVISEVSEP